MFPTKSKAKLPKTLAYPVSAKPISEALADVPQADSLSIRFSTYWALASRKSSWPHRVISVHYSYDKASQFTPHFFEELGMSEPTWSIQVEAVPSVLKNHIANLLHSEAFPRMRAWLLARKAITGNQVSQSFAVTYDEQADKLIYNDNSH